MRERPTRNSASPPASALRPPTTWSKMADQEVFLLYRRKGLGADSRRTRTRRTSRQIGGQYDLGDWSGFAIFVPKQSLINS
jgi:hypothetical protein